MKIFMFSIRLQTFQPKKLAIEIKCKTRLINQKVISVNLCSSNDEKLMEFNFEEHFVVKCLKCGNYGEKFLISIWELLKLIYHLRFIKKLFSCSSYRVTWVENLSNKSYWKGILSQTENFACLESSFFLYFDILLSLRWKKIK